MATKWGVIGTGLICSDFVHCLKGLPASEHEVVAVGARELKKAEEFIAKHGISPAAYGSYEEVANDPTVEIAYVGTINTCHYAVVMLLLSHGKHVLCEKPLGLNRKQVKEMIELARSKKRFFMEAIWSRCCPAYERLRQEIQSGRLGDIIQVNITFGVKVDHVQRVTRKDLGGSATLDIGVYVLQLTNLAFGGLRPKKVTVVGHLNEEGVDTCAVVNMLYENGGLACLNYTFRQQLTNDAYIIGTKGVVKLKQPFWMPITMELPDKQLVNFPLPKLKDSVNFLNSEGLTYEAQEVRRCLQAGWLESPLVPLNETLFLSEMMDEIRKQLGVVFDCD